MEEMEFCLTSFVKHKTLITSLHGTLERSYLPYPSILVIIRSYGLASWRSVGGENKIAYGPILQFSTGNGGRSLKNPESNIKLTLLFTS